MVKFGLTPPVPKVVRAQPHIGLRRNKEGLVN